MKKILCIGSVTADVMVNPAESIPAPGTLRAVKGISLRVGGCAANTAMDLGKMGVPVSLACKVGNDAFGRFVTETAREHEVGIEGVVVGDVETTVSVVCIAQNGERSFLYNPGSTSDYTISEIPESLLETCDIVFVAGAMLLSKIDGKPCGEFLKRAKEKGKITAMDTAWDYENIWLPKIVDALPFVDLFLPSEGEVAMLTGETEPEKMADALFAMGPKQLVIKLGSKGALLCETFEKRQYVPAFTGITPIDTTGAGDAFCAGMLAGIAQGWSLEKSCLLANATGAHCITQIGASAGIPTLDTLMQFMKERNVL